MSANRKMVMATWLVCLMIGVGKLIAGESPDAYAAAMCVIVAVYYAAPARPPKEGRDG